MFKIKFKSKKKNIGGMKLNYIKSPYESVCVLQNFRFYFLFFFSNNDDCAKSNNANPFNLININEYWIAYQTNNKNFTSVTVFFFLLGEF